MARKSLSKKLRFEIFKRDEFTCQYCGSNPPKVVLEVDHICPVSAGGGNSPDNLTTACFDCNRGKTSVELTSIPESLSSKALRVKEAELQLSEYYKILQGREDRITGEVFSVAEIMEPGCSESGFYKRHITSIRLFLEKLDKFEVSESMEQAVEAFPRGNDTTFRYFCGICWRKIKEGKENGAV